MKSLKSIPRQLLIKVLLGKCPNNTRYECRIAVATGHFYDIYYDNNQYIESVLQASK